MNAATHGGQTWLSITYDSQLFNTAEAQQLAQMYEHQIVLAHKELIGV